MYTKKLLLFLSLVTFINYSFSTPVINHSLVNIQTIDSTIVIELPYATKNNFTGQQVYSCSKCFLVQEAACALKQVQQDLAQQGLGLKIWDAYRPHQVQYKFWELVPDERYVADPNKGSRHNRGAAVDLTIIRLSDGKELDMGTEFDNFTEKASRNYQNLTDQQKANRKMLEDVMSKYGFIGLPTEWWHFDYKNWEQYPILDIPFEELS